MRDWYLAQSVKSWLSDWRLKYCIPAAIRSASDTVELESSEGSLLACEAGISWFVVAGVWGPGLTVSVVRQVMACNAGMLLVPFVVQLEVAMVGREVEPIVRTPAGASSELALVYRLIAKVG